MRHHAPWKGSVPPPACKKRQAVLPAGAFASWQPNQSAGTAWTPPTGCTKLTQPPRCWLVAGSTDQVCRGATVASGAAAPPAPVPNGIPSPLRCPSIHGGGWGATLYTPVVCTPRTYPCLVCHTLAEVLSGGSSWQAKQPRTASSQQHAPLPRLIRPRGCATWLMKLAEDRLRRVSYRVPR